MTTFADIRTEVAVALRDPDKQTFTDEQLKGMVNRAQAEIGRVAPRRFQEDITPVADDLTYPLQVGILGAVPVPEIEVLRVELWHLGEPYAQIPPADSAYAAWSDTGWKVWDGTLEIPHYVMTAIAGSESDYSFRVWGYAPYAPLSGDSDLLALSNEREQAIVTGCRVEGIRMLLAERDLFTQWQAGANNTDVTPASLMNALSIAQDDWRRTKREMMVLREGAG